MDFIQSLGVLGWLLIALASGLAFTLTRKFLTGRAEEAIKINQAKATLNTPPPAGGGVGGGGNT